MKYRLLTIECLPMFVSSFEGCQVNNALNKNKNAIWFGALKMLKGR